MILEQMRLGDARLETEDGRWVFSRDEVAAIEQILLSKHGTLFFKFPIRSALFEMRNALDDVEAFFGISEYEWWIKLRRRKRAELGYHRSEVVLMFFFEDGSVRCPYAARPIREVTDGPFTMHVHVRLDEDLDFVEFWRFKTRARHNWYRNEYNDGTIDSSHISCRVFEFRGVGEPI